MLSFDPPQKSSIWKLTTKVYMLDFLGAYSLFDISFSLLPERTVIWCYHPAISVRPINHFWLPGESYNVCLDITIGIMQVCPG
jgi:hypothetical protein